MATKTAGITLLPYAERVKLVRSRLNGLRMFGHKSIPKSAKVVAAEKVVREWQERDDAAREAYYLKARKQRNEIEDALILGDTETALKLLKALEAA